MLCDNTQCQISSALITKRRNHTTSPDVHHLEGEGLRRNLGRVSDKDRIQTRTRNIANLLEPLGNNYENLGERFQK